MRQTFLSALLPDNATIVGQTFLSALLRHVVRIMSPGPSPTPHRATTGGCPYDRDSPSLGVRPSWPPCGLEARTPGSPPPPTGPPQGVAPTMMLLREGDIPVCLSPPCGAYYVAGSIPPPPTGQPQGVASTTVILPPWECGHLGRLAGWKPALPEAPRLPPGHHRGLPLHWTNGVLPAHPERSGAKSKGRPRTRPPYPVRGRLFGPPSPTGRR